MIELKKGDCLELMKNIPDKSIDMILCDLPYGTTACKWDNIIPFEPLWEQYNRIIKDNSAIVLFGSEPFSSKLRMSNLKNYKYDWVWEKEQGVNFMLCKYQPYKVHENISVFTRKGSTKYFPQMNPGKPYTTGLSNPIEVYGGFNKREKRKNEGTRYPRSVQKFNRDKSGMHPTIKPVSLLEYLIRTYTQAGETVLDNCMGSGSTGVACINTGRNFIGIELDDHYFSIAKERIEKAQNNETN